MRNSSAPASNQESPQLLRRIVVVLALSIVGLFGFVFAKRGSPASSAAVLPSQPGNASVLDAVDALRTEMRDIRKEIAQLSMLRESAQRDSSEGTEIPSQLSALVSRLDQLLADRGTNAQHHSTAPEGAGNYSSLDSLWTELEADRLPLAVAPGDSKPTVEGGLVRAHLFWTLDRVVNVYGIPELIIAGPATLRLAYRGEPPSTRWLEFTLADGRVIGANAHR